MSLRYLQRDHRKGEGSAHILAMWLLTGSIMHLLIMLYSLTQQILLHAGFRCKARNIFWMEEGCEKVAIVVT